MPEEETQEETRQEPQVKVYEEPTDRFMIIKGGHLAPHDLASLEKTLEDIESRLRAILQALRNRIDPTKLNASLDSIKTNLEDIHQSDFARFEHSITSGGFYPLETFESLEPVIDSFISYSAHQISTGSPSPAYPLIKQAAQTGKDFMASHHADRRELPSEKRFKLFSSSCITIQKRIAGICKEILTLIGASPPARDEPPELNRAAGALNDYLQFFLEETKDLIPKVSTPESAKAISAWATKSAGHVKGMVLEFNNAATANKGQAPAHLTSALQVLANQGGISKIASVPWPDYTDANAINELKGSWEALRKATQGKPTAAAPSINDQIEKSISLVRQILGTLDTLSKTTFYSPATPPPTRPGKAPGEEEEKKVEGDEEKLRKTLAELSQKLKQDLGSHEDEERKVIAQVRDYLEYLIKVQQSHEDYRDQVELQHILPQIERLNNIGIDFKKIYEDFNLSVWARFTKQNLEDALAKEAAKELADIAELKKKIIARFRNDAGTRGLAALKAENIYEPFIHLISTIEEKSKSRAAKIAELRGAIKEIPKTSSKFTEERLKTIVDRINTIEKQKNHKGALDQTIKDLHTFLSAHQEVYTLSEQANKLVAEIKELTESPEIHAITDKRSGVSYILEKLKLNQTGSVIRQQ